MVAIKYPFSRPEIRESELKDWLVQALYPREFSAGGSTKTCAKNRVTSRIHYARRMDVLARAENRSVHAATFFEWACAQRGWEVLAKVDGLPRNASNSDLYSSPAREWFSAVSFDFADSS